MISQTLRNVFVRQDAEGLSLVTVETDQSFYQMEGEGFSRLVGSQPKGEAILPAAFVGKRIVELRCNGEDLSMRLEDGSYMSIGWLIDTHSGEGYLDVLFHEVDEVDANFLEFFHSLDSYQEIL